MKLIRKKIWWELSFQETKYKQLFKYTMIIKDLGGKSHWGDIKWKQAFKELNK